MAKPDIVIMSFVDFPEYGMKPLLNWLEKHDLAHKPRILCMPKLVARQFSASVGCSPTSCCRCRCVRK
jgi:hypothetical protein